ncbi:MAG: hypothetical protein R3F61_27365 [Myxococcota bacterium]
MLRFDLQGVSSAAALAERMSEHAALQRSWLEERVEGVFGGWRKTDPWDSLEELLKRRARGGFVVLVDEVALYIDHIARRSRDQARTDLRRLLGLRESTPARFVLTGSISLRPLATQLGVPLSADWTSMRLGPLERSDAKTLFEHECQAVCLDAVAGEGWRMTGGYPRWLKRLAQATQAPMVAVADLAHLEEAVTRLLRSQPFTAELGHLDRHADPAALRHALHLAAQPGSNEASIVAGLQQRRLTRQQAVLVLDVLRDEFVLDADLGFTLPLFQRWLQEHT